MDTKDKVRFRAAKFGTLSVSVAVCLDFFGVNVKANVYQYIALKILTQSYIVKFYF